MIEPKRAYRCNLCGNISYRAKVRGRWPVWIQSFCGYAGKTGRLYRHNPATFKRDVLWVARHENGRWFPELHGWTAEACLHAIKTLGHPSWVRAGKLRPKQIRIQEVKSPPLQKKGTKHATDNRNRRRSLGPCKKSCQAG